MKIINFVTHSTSSSSLFDLPDQWGAARVLHSYNCLCSVSLYTATNYIFLGKDNANFVKFYQKARKTNRALQLYANYKVFDNYTCKQEPTFANVHCLADRSSVRCKTST